MNKVAKVGIGVLVVAGIGVAVVTTTNGESPIALPQPPPAQAQVAALVDGDTFDVRFNDQVTRVRLGNVDAPATPQPGQPATCLGTEASAQLSSMIPAGTALTLTYDKDRFGRTVAQAVTSDGRLVNAEVVRSGLAQEIQADSGNPTPPAIDAAARDALSNKRGMHSADIACTVPGQVKAVVDQVAKVPAAPPPGADVPTLATDANNATDARMAADELDSDFAQNRQDLAWLVLDPNERAQLETQVKTARDRAAADETALRNATNLTVNQDATQAATQREAARIAKALADIRKAEADRARRPHGGRPRRARQRPMPRLRSSRPTSRERTRRPRTTPIKLSPRKTSSSRTRTPTTRTRADPTRAAARVRRATADPRTTADPTQAPARRRARTTRRPRLPPTASASPPAGRGTSVSNDSAGRWSRRSAVPRDRCG